MKKNFHDVSKNTLKNLYFANGSSNFGRVTSEDCLILSRRNRKRKNPYDLNKERLITKKELEEDFKSSIGYYDVITEGDYYLLCFCDE